MVHDFSILKWMFFNLLTREYLMYHIKYINITWAMCSNDTISYQSDAEHEIFLYSQTRVEEIVTDSALKFHQ